MKARLLIAAAVVALLAAGTASAYTLRTVWLKSGQCAKVHGTKVCARNATTVTVAPSPIGKTFTGNGDSTLAPVTLKHGAMAHWTSHPDSLGFNSFNVASDPSDTRYITFDNGNNSASGSSYIPAGTYTFSVSASGAWTFSF